VPGGTERNLESLRGRLRFAPDIDRALQLTLADAQTSGGLLIAIGEDDLEALLAGLRERGTGGAVIGRIVSGDEGAIAVEP
jgi:selenide,water dikinase